MGDILSRPLYIKSLTRKETEFSLLDLDRYMEIQYKILISVVYIALCNICKFSGFMLKIFDKSDIIIV